jgi:hypothetical protein
MAHYVLRGACLLSNVDVSASCGLERHFLAENKLGRRNGMEDVKVFSMQLTHGPARVHRAYGARSQPSAQTRGVAPKKVTLEVLQPKVSQASPTNFTPRYPKAHSTVQ